MANFVMYHYTNPEGWDGIVNGRRGYLVSHPITNKWVESETVKGWMIPQRRLIPMGIESSLVSDEATSGAIFGLPEERPDSWLNYYDSGCLNIFNLLMGSCKRTEDKLILLKINLIESDNPFVVDYFHTRKMARDLMEIKDIKDRRKRLAEGHRDYWNSRIGLKEYKGDYILPEIVTFSAIPIGRLEFIKEITF